MDVIRMAVQQSGIVLLRQCSYLIKCDNIKEVCELVRLAIRTQFHTYRFAWSDTESKYMHEKPNLPFWRGCPLFTEYNPLWSRICDLCSKRPIVYDDITQRYYNRELITPLFFYYNLSIKNVMPPLQDMLQLIDEAIQMDPRAVHYIPRYLYRDHLDQIVDILCRHAHNLVLLYPNWQCDIAKYLHQSSDCIHAWDYLNAAKGLNLHVPRFVRHIIEETSFATMRYHVYRCLFFALSTANKMARLAPHYAPSLMDVILVLQ